jgi:lipopolysaccharide export system permease protein
MISTLNRYIAKKILIGILIAFLIVTSVIMLVDFVEASRNFESGSGVNMATLLIMTGLNAPQLVEQTIPFVVLFGVMGALFGLNKRSEIIVLRASGLSAWRFLKPAAIVTAIIGVLWALAFNPLAAFSSKKYENVVNKATQSDQKNVSKQGRIWLREGNAKGQLVVFADRSNIAEHKLFDVTFYYSDLDKSGRPVFSVRYDAESAELFRNNYWLLKNVVENEAGKPSQKFQSISKITSLSWETLRSRARAENKPPFWRITSEITKARNAGFDATPLLMQFHKLLALPITLIAMSIIAAGASLNTAREGGTLKLLIIGASLGFGVYFTDSIISAFGASGAIPPVLAAWSIPLLVLSCGLAFLSSTEDG